MRESSSTYVEFHVIKREFETGQILEEAMGHNIVVKDGRSMVLEFIAGMTTASSFPYMSVGASATDNGESDTTDLVSDTRLTHELIGNATRFTCTDSAGGSLTTADIQDDVVTIDGTDFYKSLTMKASMPSTDGNDGQPVREIALVSVQATPAAPKTASGTIYDHLILPSTITKDTGTTIDILLTLHV